MRALKAIAAGSLLFAVVAVMMGCAGGTSSVSMRSGMVYLEKNKDYPKAEMMFRKAITENPSDWNAYFQLGRSLAEQAKYREAGEAFITSQKLAPEEKKAMPRDMQRHYFVSRFNAGVSANGVRNYKEAVAEFESAVAVDPSDAKGYVNLAYAYSMLGDDARATEALKAAVTADSTSVDAWRNLAISYQNAKEYDQAANAMEHVLALAPNDAEALFTLGDIYFNRKDYEKALQNYLKCAETKKDDAALDYQIGTTYFRLENYKDAGLAFQKSAALSRDKDKELYNDSMYNLGVCYVKLADYKNAISTLEALVGTHETAEVWEMLGAAYAKDEQKDKAIAAFEKAKALSGK